MQIELLSLSRRRDVDTHASLTHRARFALDRFASLVDVMKVRIVDENGPKGGIDQRCCVDVRLADGRRVRASARAARVPQAIDAALKRCREVLVRQLDRRRRLERRGRGVARIDFLLPA